MAIAALLLTALLAVPGLFQGPRAPIVLADFEGADYGAWVATGTAFGTGPARGTLPGQMPVSGFRGRGLVNSYLGGDGSTGSLTSPPFVIARRYLSFLIGGGRHPGQTCINLLVDRQVVRTATGPNDKPGGTERLEWHDWDVSDLEGKQARIEILDNATGGWGHINIDEIIMTDERMAEDVDTSRLYDETYRPQFHFTPARNWMNDPNGLVYYRGEYHLFFQHNPLEIEWGNMTWGHAVSRDLVHWKQVANALEPDALGTMFSGSAVVDHENTAGFRTGSEKTLVALYTAAGGTSPESQGRKFTQCLAYSNDRGRTWTKYAGNPVLDHVAAENRDPKVVWHAPTRRWIMALYLDKNTFAFYSSPNLKQWTELQRIDVPECAECPDFFPMPVRGRPGETRWVWTAANGRYLVGRFDGKRFEPEQPLAQSDYGANFYAVQTYSDIPPSDGRRIQIAWMVGGQYPKMPFNQQMSFPCELTLRPAEDGTLRLYRWPVREIRSLRERSIQWSGVRLGEDGGAPALEGELWDIEMEVELAGASTLVIGIRGHNLEYRAGAQRLVFLGREAPLAPVRGRIQLRLLVDRTSVEVFGNGGQVSLSSCFLPRQRDRKITFHAEGGSARIVHLRAHTLRSAWKQPDTVSKGR